MTIVILTHVCLLSEGIMSREDYHSYPFSLPFSLPYPLPCNTQDSPPLRPCPQPPALGCTPLRARIAKFLEFNTHLCTFPCFFVSRTYIIFSAGWGQRSCKVRPLTGKHTFTMIVC